MQSTQTQENEQERHNSLIVSNEDYHLKILYNDDYSHNDFPSKFEKEEVEKVYHRKNIVESKKSINEFFEIKENPDDHVKIDL